jgi:hypothetical protein
MRQAKSLRMLFLGMWLVMTGLVVVVSTVITAMANRERELES